MKKEISLFWFRRDLRLEDNVGLTHALKGNYPVLPIFIFDKNILSKLPRDDARLNFIYDTLEKINKTIEKDFKSSVAYLHDTPKEAFKKLMSEYDVQQVYTNSDYEPYAIKRDSQIKKLLSENKIELLTFKDQVIFEKNEVVKSDGEPYVVYTPFKNRWKEKFRVEKSIEIKNTTKYLKNLLQINLSNPQLSELGFEKSSIKVPEYNVTHTLIENYEKTRNFPAIKNGTSHLGPHLRFGTVSVRQMVKKAIAEKNEVFWNELIWREFFMQILWHFPHTVNKSFRPKYDRIDWRNNEKEFKKWCNGETGYALVDAGLRQLNQTGYMHNRVRMLVASFLCKHLLIDWRWGEAYFAEKLLDYDQSANVGNWQWAAGSGVDAAPYFRIFNPMTQVDKFDKKKEYINKWVTDLQELTYPSKMVDHKMARERCLTVYKEALK
ncbi:deoxyribodipyrimidine photo-lyase [Aurantibacter sp.]|uniref:cryptochrome/photolyase family protein n=1 Tax=Aurantibacter sp. TaxID=2807103 RepID=UPI00326747B1